MGGVSESWQAVAGLSGLRAEVNSLKSAEQLEGMRLDHRVTHLVRLRYRAGITTAMRVLFGSRVLQIRSAIDPYERHERLDLLCEEVSA